MEVTLLIEAMDSSFNLLEKARNQAVALLDSTVRLTSETRYMEEKKVLALLKGTPSKKTKLQNFIAAFFILFGFWILLSGKFDIFHLLLGVGCSFIIAFLTHDLLFANIRVGNTRIVTQRLLFYFPWLIYQVILSNIQVAYLALSTKILISPQIIKFKTKLESDISWVTLANSITLTPGTITMDIKDGEFFVHALDTKFAEDLNAGEMEDKVAHIFMEADHIYVQDVLDVAPIFGQLRKNI